MLSADDPTSPELSSSLAQAARQRREIFASRREAYDNYASKPPLSVLDPRALAAYVDFGFEDLPDGTVRLRCRGENEALIYERSFDHPAFSRLATVRCPTLRRLRQRVRQLHAGGALPVAERLATRAPRGARRARALRASRAARRRGRVGDPGH